MMATTKQNSAMQKRPSPVAAASKLYLELEPYGLGRRQAVMNAIEHLNDMDSQHNENIIYKRRLRKIARLVEKSKSVEFYELRTVLDQIGELAGEGDADE